MSKRDYKYIEYTRDDIDDIRYDRDEQCLVITTKKTLKTGECRGYKFALPLLPLLLLLPEMTAAYELATGILDAIYGKNQYEIVMPADKGQKSDEEQQRQLITRQLERLRGNLKAFHENAKLLDKARRVQSQKENAESFRDAAKAFYERIQEAAQDYESEMKPRISAFIALMSDLACFAGCQTPEQFDALDATLSNKRSHIRSLVNRYRDRPGLFDAGCIPAFPDYQRPTEATGSVESGYADSALKERVDRALEEMKASLKTHPRNKPGKLPEWEELFADCQNSDWWSKKPDAEQAKQARKAEEARKKANEYLADAGKWEAYLKQHEKDWDYARLLCKAYPILEKIADSPETLTEEEWCAKCAEIGCELWRMLEGGQEEYRKIRFRWITPDSEESRRSESIRVDFQAREASWPGLYCYERGRGEALICVIHGGVDDSVSF